MLIRNILAMVLMMASLTAFGAEEEKEDDAIIGEVQITHQVSRNKSVERSLTGVLVYAEKPLTTDYAVFGNAYADQGFKTVGIGISRKFGDVQVAVGVGKAYYGGASYTMPHGFVYYSAEDIDGFLYAEKYLGETVDPVFVKGYLTKGFGKWIVGVYGETGMGVGPLVGYKIADTMKITLVVPIAGQPDKVDGGVKVKVALVAAF